jgi:hypothetical protein
VKSAFSISKSTAWGNKCTNTRLHKRSMTTLVRAHHYPHCVLKRELTPLVETHLPNHMHPDKTNVNPFYTGHALKSGLGRVCAAAPFAYLRPRTT